MAEHNFVIGLFGEADTVAGAQCSRYSQIVLFENGKIPEDIRKQVCPAKCGDVDQAATWIVREATKDLAIQAALLWQ
jgi:hypothetical protein